MMGYSLENVALVIMAFYSETMHHIQILISRRLFISRSQFFQVLESRNKLMHSPDNIMKEEETQEIIKWSRVLLGCLDITEKTYYKDAIAELEDVRIF
jgi:hypothetical protein